MFTWPYVTTIVTLVFKCLALSPILIIFKWYSLCVFVYIPWAHLVWFFFFAFVLFIYLFLLVPEEFRGNWLNIEKSSILAIQYVDCRILGYKTESQTTVFFPIKRMHIARKLENSSFLQSKQSLNLISLLHPTQRLEFLGGEQFSSLVKMWFPMTEILKTKTYLPPTCPIHNGREKSNL